MSAEPTQIERMGSTGLRVVWSDGHQSLYTWPALRAACPCAACKNRVWKAGGEAALQPVEIRPVGRYAMTVRWNDGHTTGIFSFDYLRSLCACEECKPSQFLEG